MRPLTPSSATYSATVRFESYWPMRIAKLGWRRNVPEVFSLQSRTSPAAYSNDRGRAPATTAELFSKVIL
ncbi:MAG: hypothetical protein JOZ62_00590 [Acidobacteriaceae bacterium]|nr:hypothetical protein [Acidobacteriaceae bacterium]